ncbi:TonB-dependent receptor [Hydrogenimonas urashimensis]|uniref:TonB-dependent receptor n=1 Tax=Hydrogenimonas urashimensis TaxID=2740515 RepID=UPI00191684ED|nr:TonB-dependent receptor [Hydrogenimonas urashimensis]
MKKSFLLLSLAAVWAMADETLAPVSVVAVGEEEPVIQQPLSVSVKKKKEIELDQVIFQKDLFNSLSGVRIEQTGSVFGHMTSIRMPINTGPYYLFTQDGIPVQSSGFFNHNGLAYTSFDSASSVEVLKGAGTALYGSDAVAAVVDVQTLQAPAKKPEAKVSVRGGSDQYASGYVEASAPIDEDSGIRANVNYVYSGGWRDHTQAYRMAGNFRYDTPIGENNVLKLLLNATKTDAEQADSFNDYKNIEDGSTAASDDPDYFKALQKTDVRRKFDFARISAEWSNYSIEDLEVVVTPYIRYNRNRYVATWQPNLPSNDNELTTFGLVQRNNWDLGRGRIIFGFDTEYTKSSLEYTQDFDITTTGWKPKTYVAGPLYDYDVDYFAIAPYLHGELDVTSTVRLTAGLRYDYNRYEYTNNLEPDSVDPSGTYFRPADRTDSFNHLSPKVALSYMPSPAFNLYARYANGFRIPQASRLYSMKAGYENVRLDPETSDTYEVGLKTLFNDHLFVDIAAYYMSIDDTIIRYKTENGDYYYDNGGASIHKGIELTTAYEISKAWRIKLAYAYSRHNYDNDPKYGDNELQQAPNHTGNLRVFYKPPVFPGLEVMGEYVYVGSWWLDDDHEAGKYKGYRLGNLKATYRMNDRLKLFAKIDNITDEKYAVMARYAYGKTDYTPGSPAQGYLGIEYQW